MEMHGEMSASLVTLPMPLVNAWFSSCHNIEQSICNVYMNNKLDHLTNSASHAILSWKGGIRMEVYEKQYQPKTIKRDFG